MESHGYHGILAYMLFITHSTKYVLETPYPVTLIQWLVEFWVWGPQSYSMTARPDTYSVGNISGSYFIDTNPDF